VEKSIDGVRFNSIAAVTNVTNGNRSAQYGVVDLNPMQGLNYYRVKSVDVSGQILYTNVAKVFFEVKKSQISVYPNPIQNGIVNLYLENQMSGVYQVRLLNIAGQVIAQRQINHMEQGSKYAFGFDSNIPSGNYQVEVVNPAGKRTMIAVVY
jgi:hypothetical protein